MKKKQRQHLEIAAEVCAIQTLALGFAGPYTVRRGIETILNTPELLDSVKAEFEMSIEQLIQGLDELGIMDREFSFD